MEINVIRSCVCGWTVRRCKLLEIWNVSRQNKGSSDRLAIGLGFSICGKGIAPILILTECPCLVTLHLTILKIEPSNYAEFLFQFFFYFKLKIRK